MSGLFSNVRLCSLQTRSDGISPSSSIKESTPRAPTAAEQAGKALGVSGTTVPALSYAKRRLFRLGRRGTRLQVANISERACRKLPNRLLHSTSPPAKNWRNWQGYYARNPDKEPGFFIHFSKNGLKIIPVITYSDKCQRATNEN